jgi:hypothetical protein
MRLEEVLVTLLVSSMAMAAAVHVLIFSRLRARHRRVWEGIGRPILFFDLPVRKSREYHDFFKHRGYKTLGDRELNALLWLKKGLFWVYSAVLLLYVAKKL